MSQEKEKKTIKLKNLNQNSKEIVIRNVKVKQKNYKIKSSKQISKKSKKRVKARKQTTDSETQSSSELHPESESKLQNLKMYGGFVYKNFCDIIYNNFYIVTSVSMMVNIIESSSYILS